eukprot:symbB.v1.2.019814.t1/scaffold1640.1/size107948/3
MERVEESLQHICEERQRWQDRCEVVEAAEDLKLLEAETAQLRGKMPLRQAALKAARHEGEELREMVTSWQSKLEPLRRELQMKEADLDERSSSMLRRREKLEQSEQCLAQQRMESEVAAASHAPNAARQRKAELQQQLEELCEEVDQKQQMLQDIRCKKTERISTLRDDLAAAELAECAWRDRCATLEGRKKELLEQIQLEESQVNAKVTRGDGACKELGRCRKCNKQVAVPEYVCNSLARQGAVSTAPVRRVRTYEASIQAPILGGSSSC